MCGRYYRKSDKQKIAETLHTTNIDDFPVPPWDYNVAPTSMQPIVSSECSFNSTTRVTAPRGTRSDGETADIRANLL